MVIFLFFTFLFFYSDLHQLYCFNFTWAQLCRLSSAKEPGSGLCPEDLAQQQIAAVGIHVSKDNHVNKIFQRRSFWGPHLFPYLECGSVLGVKGAPSSFELYTTHLKELKTLGEAMDRVGLGFRPTR